MPRRSVLSTAEKEALLAWPIDEVERIRFYTLSSKDIAIVRERRGAANRLGFAVQLCAMRYPGVVLGSEKIPPSWLLERLAKQLKLSANWTEYLEHQYTRGQHVLAIQSMYGFTLFSRACVRDAVESLASTAFHSDKGIVVAQVLVDYLRKQRILLPPLPVIERLCAQAITQADRRIYARLCESITPQQQEKLEGFLGVMPETKMTRLRWLCQPPKAATAKQILEHIERLRILSELNLSAEIGRNISPQRLRKIARQGAQMTPPDLARFEARRRLATLVAVVCETRATLIDETVELHDRIVGAAFNRAKRTQEHQWGQVGKAVNEKVRLYAQIGQSLLDAREKGVEKGDEKGVEKGDEKGDEKGVEKGDDVFAAIEAILSWEQFSQSVADAKQLAQPAEFDTLPRLVESYVTIRRYAPAWLESLSFSAAPSSQNLITAVELLRDLNRRAVRKVPDDAPLNFVRKRWRALVCTVEGIDRRFYELCVLIELKNALRSGDVWVHGSRTFKEFDTYLVPSEEFEQLRCEQALPLGVEPDPEKYLQTRLAHLTQELDVVEGLAKKGTLPDARIEAAGLKFTPLTNTVPAEAEALIQRIGALLPRVKITDLLLEVESWTNFSCHFTHLGNGQPPPKPSLLLAAILADGLKRMVSIWV